MKGDDMIQGVNEIKQEVKHHFSLHFSEEWNSRPFVEGIDFNSLSADDNAYNAPTKISKIFSQDINN
jgi:hypothetical protein